VRFLVDAQLPPALAQFLIESGHAAEHVFDIGLERAEDSSIWDQATLHSAVIITKDEDFAVRATLNPQGPAVVWLRIGNCSNRALLQWFTPMFAHVLNSLNQGEKLIEII
jgi:predicted nuclease of predicted toxin-antitoxin system